MGNVDDNVDASVNVNVNVVDNSFGDFDLDVFHQTVILYLWL